jgi:hypothetical protein
MLSPLQSQQHSRKLVEEDLIQIHHDLMCVYGWIPLEEFKALPIPTLLTLNSMVQKEKGNRENLRLVLLKFCGVKNPK